MIKKPHQAHVSHRKESQVNQSRNSYQAGICQKPNCFKHEFTGLFKPANMHFLKLHLDKTCGIGSI